MRYTGQLDTWQDDRGFGFIRPDLGGGRLFVHATAFQNRLRRPAVGDIVSYEIVDDGNGKRQALVVVYAGERLRQVQSSVRPRELMIVGLVAAAFLLAVVWLGRSGQLPWPLVWLYLGASPVAFVMYWLDKSAARRGRWRTQESSLLLCGLVGGWPGAFVAQRLFRHKSAKLPFQLCFWATVLVNIGALGWALSPAGVGKLSVLIAASREALLRMLKLLLILLQ
ncbi:DUF1294 domain-containing protein [Methylovulum psychrotolerans]|uniref:CSD domain-containing protein n=1 Tax=Methylovulum psychrotolerans TaxID=1704499 RepID=A0A2S5CNR4_9GAMM|nr:cold shock and DUF1294 domain-containing protein [Methylovulum psychrotolerans]POZ52453.1 hypothetical protein AADEFJLK_01935 [Methylovulum psychrotolerans]